MANLFDLLKQHASETFNTLNQGRPGQSVRAIAGNTADNFNTAFGDMSVNDVAMAFAPGGFAGSVKLPVAKLFNKGLSIEAKRLLKKGADPQRIWELTGYHPLGDKMVGEISDVGTGWNMDALNKMLRETSKGNKASAPLSELIDHPELFQNYPKLEKPHILFNPVEGKLGGFYDPNSTMINLNGNVHPFIIQGLQK